MDISVKKRILLTFYSEVQWAFDSLSGVLQWDASNSTQKPTEEKFIELATVLTLNDAKTKKIDLLNKAFNASKKITIQNGKTLEIAHNTTEREYFLKLIEEVKYLNFSNLDSIPNTAYEYEQSTDSDVLGFRILPEIATYIFKDLFVAALKNGTKVNARRHNKSIIYNNTLAKIKNATTQSELDAVTWTFANPQGIVIDVNHKAAEMLADPSVSDFAKDAINAAKDPITGEIHFIKTLQELADDS